MGGGASIFHASAMTERRLAFASRPCTRGGGWSGPSLLYLNLLLDPLLGPTRVVEYAAEYVAYSLPPRPCGKYA